MCLVLQHELRYLALEQLKTSDHLTPTGIAAIKNIENNKCWQGPRKTGALVYCWWEHKMA